MSISVDSIANAIVEANKDKQAYIARNKDGLWLSHTGGFIKSRSSAMRLVDAEAFNHQRWTDQQLEVIPVRQNKKTA